MPESRDYWDMVFERVARRPLVKLGLAVLALVYAAAIYAPLIAGDRPLLLEAIDTKEYDDARKGLASVAASIRGLAREGRAGYARARAENPAAPSFDAALALEGGALARRLALMQSYLAAEQAAALGGLQVEAGVALAAIQAGRQEAEAQADQLVQRARELRERFALRAEGDPAERGVELVPKRSYPLLTAITWIEVFLMLLWALVLSWPLWNRALNARLLRGQRERIRAARRKKLAVVLLVPLAAGLGWKVTVDGGVAFEGATFKERLDRGEIRATRVWFPPLALGFAEIHLEEGYRPPTWSGSSERDTAGAYVRGPRVPEPDPVTGRTPEPQPVEVRFGEPARNATWRHVFGTDESGRDLFVRMLHGGRISLSVGLISTLLLVTIGVLVGATAGYAGGRVDLLLSRLIEVVQSIPAFFLILTAVALVPARTLHPIIAIVLFIGAVRWTGIARLVRAEILRLKEQDFVVAARAIGLTPARVVWRHVLPNALGPVLVAAAFSVAAGILTESAISFLGFGVREPIPSWGSLLAESRSPEHWWIQVFPGLAIFVTVLAYNLVGEGLRDALDPRSRA